MLNDHLTDIYYDVTNANRVQHNEQYFYSKFIGKFTLQDSTLYNEALYGLQIDSKIERNDHVEELN